MITKGIRGAITIDSNSEEDLKSATLELLGEMVEKNNIKKNKRNIFISVRLLRVNLAFFFIFSP